VTHVEIVAWYDSEWAYANRLVGLARISAGLPITGAVAR
jgi:glyceraldehyde-3-phosphate dehydrogenase/erythrose-4-phosphate dehydrogenase